MNKLITHARKFATAAHEGQLRKYTGEKYIVHPAAVAKKVKELGGSTDMICAAWLHDTVEDCGVSITEIYNEFGDNIARMVAGMTNDSIGSRKERHAADIEKFSKAGTNVQIIRLCDIGHNMISIIKHDPKFAPVWCQEKVDYLYQMKFIRQSAEDTPLVEYYWGVFDEIKRGTL